MPAKYYYFIEDLDITADNIPDGILVRQCKLDIKKNLIIYNKNLYLSDKTLSLIINDITDVNDKKAHKPIYVIKPPIKTVTKSFEYTIFFFIILSLFIVSTVIKEGLITTKIIIIINGGNK